MSIMDELIQEIDDGFFKNIDGEDMPRKGRNYVLLATAKNYIIPRIKKAIANEKRDMLVGLIENSHEEYIAFMGAIKSVPVRTIQAMIDKLDKEIGT